MFDRVLNTPLNFLRMVYKPFFNKQSMLRGTDQVTKSTIALSSWQQFYYKLFVCSTWNHIKCKSCKIFGAIEFNTISSGNKHIYITSPSRSKCHPHFRSIHLSNQKYKNHSYLSVVHVLVR